MENLEIRSAYMQAGVKQWHVAEELGISETCFSRKLRKELPPEEKKKILEAIRRLGWEKGVV